jgi:endonuclease/exonuclease/phosphatase family metal-dependent hydrolase
MIRKRCPILALSVALARAAGPHPDPLETIREGTYSHSQAFDPAIAILNWNIDRGKHLDRIAEAVRQAKAELCIFQEVDLGARRTQGKDVARELAQALEMNYAFAPEFRELSQSTGGEPAYHGQAILTRLPMRNVRILRFTHQSGFWQPKPLMISALPLFQRREGGRIALAGELDNGGKMLVVYNLHLESRGDDQGRLLQLEEVLADADRYPAGTPVIVAGDLNTKTRHSALVPRLRQAGYRNAFGDRRVRTHVILGGFDYIFVRGTIQLEDARIVRGTHASDHDPISVQARF